MVKKLCKSSKNDWKLVSLTRLCTSVYDANPGASVLPPIRTAEPFYINTDIGAHHVCSRHVKCGVRLKFKHFWLHRGFHLPFPKQSSNVKLLFTALFDTNTKYQIITLLQSTVCPTRALLPMILENFDNIFECLISTLWLRR